MAASARRTLANVKSSAMMPRHPEVPNLMSEVVCNPAFELMARYFSPSRRDLKAIIMKGPLKQENESRKSKKHADRPRHLPVSCPRAEDCARRRTKAPCRMRQRRLHSGRIFLHLEGQARIGSRASADHQNHGYPVVTIGKGSESPAQLRSIGIPRRPGDCRLRAVPGLVGRSYSRWLSSNHDITGNLTGLSANRIESAC